MLSLPKTTKNEDLTFPHSNPAAGKKESDSYSNIAVNVPQFHAINTLPIVLDPSMLDEGDGIDKTLRVNNTKYHQSCNSKLDRARRRTLSSTEDESSR